MAYANEKRMQITKNSQSDETIHCTNDWLDRIVCLPNGIMQMFESKIKLFVSNDLAILELHFTMPDCHELK